MTGSLRHGAAGTLPDDPYRRAVVRLDDGSDVAYRDVRRFGTWLLLEPDELDPYLDARVGPEPLARRPTGRETSPRELARRQSARQGGDPRPADRRRRREHLRRRGALARPDPSARAGGVARARRGQGAPSRHPPALQQGSAARDRRSATTRCRTAGAGRCRTSSRSTGAAASRATAAGRRSRRSEAAGRGTWYCPSCQRLPRGAVRGAESAISPLDWPGWPGVTSKTDAVVLRSLRYSEADRILHLYTPERGRVGAIAKGVRKTKSRFGARLEPLSHVELMLHEGSGELQTVTGVDLMRSHHAMREEPYRLERRADRGRGDAAALRRARGERARIRGARAVPRPARRSAGRRSRARARPARALVPAEAALALRLPAAPHELCRVRRDEELVGFSARAGGAVCARPRRRGARGSRRKGSPGSSSCSRRRSPTRVGATLSDRARRDALAVVTSSYEEHGGFRLRTLSA